MQQTEWDQLFGPVFMVDEGGAKKEMEGVSAFKQRFAGLEGQFLWEAFGKHYIINWGARVMLFSSNGTKLCDRHRENQREQESEELNYLKRVLAEGVQTSRRGAEGSASAYHGDDSIEQRAPGIYSTHSGHSGHSE